MMKYTLNSFLSSILPIFFIYLFSFNALSNSYYAYAFLYPGHVEAYGGSELDACTALPTNSQSFPDDISVDNGVCLEGVYDNIGSVCKLVDSNIIAPSAYYEITEGDQFDLTFSSSAFVIGDCGRPSVNISGLNTSIFNVVSGTYTDLTTVYAVTSPQTLGVQSIQNEYFSGDKLISLTFEGQSSSLPPVSSVLTNTNTVINIIDDEPVPVVSFTGLNKITEGESIDLAISLDAAIDDGFSLLLTLNDANLLTSQGALVVGHGYFTSVTNASIPTDKVSLSQLSLTANSINDEKNLGNKELTFTADLVKEGKSYSSATFSVFIQDDDPLSPEEELGYECPMSPHPVNIRTGNKYLKYADSVVRDKGYNFELIRHYNSFTKEWTFEFERFLTILPDKVKVTRGGGKVIIFNYNSGIFSTEIATGISLSIVDNHYELDLMNGSVEIYNAIGQLQSITYRNQIGLNYLYQASKIIINSNFNNTLFNIDLNLNGDVISILTSSGENITYAYTNDNLTKITNTNGSSIDYLYSAGFLVQATENGFITNNITYDGEGRVTQSKVGDTGDFDSFVYAPAMTTVTNSLGKSTKYNYTLINGHYKISSVVGEASTNCVASDTTYQYDSIGFLVSKTDANGVSTIYNRDAHGREIRRTEAATTPNERVIDTTWDVNLDLPLSIITPSITTNFYYNTKGLLQRKDVNPSVTVPQI